MSAPEGALPTSVARLIEELSKLPGIGPKTASRLTFYLLRAPDEQVNALAEAVRALKLGLVECERCCHIAESSPCAICRDEGREQSVVCVVEDPLDVVAIERTGAYRGLYHVLHGAISPVEGILPQDLRIAQLIARLDREPIREVILATNPSLEGETTATYIVRQIGDRPIRVTRLARGLPMGGDLEYADEMTLIRALEGRSEVQ